MVIYEPMIWSQCPKIDLVDFSTSKWYTLGFNPYKMWTYAPPDVWFGRQRTDVTEKARPATPLCNQEDILGSPNYGRSFTDVTILQDPPPRIPPNECSYGRIHTDVSLHLSKNPSNFIGTVNDPALRTTGRSHCHGRKQTDLTKFTVFSYEDENRLIGPDRTRVCYPTDLVEKIDRACSFRRCPVGRRRIHDDNTKWSNDRCNQPRPPSR